MTHARGMRLFYESMGTVLGLLGILLFIACVIGVAAAITWLVVKVSPAVRPKPEEPQP
jgi:uncharacterized BrkB/YihY/UPF0761 family membrane protein